LTKLNLKLRKATSQINWIGPAQVKAAVWG
jgi:hypothetical protein